MEWWQDPADPDYFSDTFLLEQNEMKDKLDPGTETRIEMQVEWDDPLWVRSEHLKLGRKGSAIHWILRVRFGWEKLLEPASKRGKPKVSIEWEKEAWEFRIEYPSNYPASAPRAIVQKPRLVLFTPHIWRGALCLFNPSDGREYGWNPNTGTGATIALWAIEWVRAYLYWHRTSKWPGIQETVH